MVVLMRSKSIDDHPIDNLRASKASLPIVKEEDSKSSIFSTDNPVKSFQPVKE